MIQRLTNLKKEEEKRRLALDVETRWNDGVEHEEDEVPRPIYNNGKLEGIARLIQIGLPPTVEDFQYVIDLKKLCKAPDDMLVVGAGLKPIIEDSIIYGQNLQYEFQYMWAMFGIRIPANNIRDVRYIRAVMSAGDKSARSNLGALYDDYLDPHFFREYTGVYQSEYKSHKEVMQRSDWNADTLTPYQLTYAADDVSRLIFELYDSMLETHETRSVDAFIDKYEKKNAWGQTVTKPIKNEWKLIPIFSMMELRGMQYDLDYHNREVTPYLNEIMERNKAVVEKYFTKPKKIWNGRYGKAREVRWETECININSYKQVLPALKTLGINLPNYQEETLMLAGEEYDHEALHAIIDYKKASSMASKYGNKMPRYVKSTGRLHPVWQQMGGDQAIVTGRSSAKDPPVLTIPSGEDEEEFNGKSTATLFRTPFIPREGYVLIDSDYVQMEPTAMAAECKDQVLLDIYNNTDSTKDISRHSLTAKFMFNLPDFPDKKSPYYKAGKTYNLGSTYGMGLEKGCYKIKVATKGVIDLTMAELKEKRDSLYGELKGLKAAQDEITRRVKQMAGKGLSRFLNSKQPICVFHTSFGRPRSWFLSQLISKEVFEEARKHPEILDADYGDDRERWKNVYNSVVSKISRDAFNFVKGQGICADIFKLALIYVQEALDEQGFDFTTEGIILVMHDEIMLEVKKENEEKAKNILNTCMLRAAYDIIEGVTFKVDTKSGSSWATAH